MAKTKKKKSKEIDGNRKVKQKTVDTPKLKGPPEKELTAITYKHLRAIKSDPFNWRLEKLGETGKWSTKGYYGSISKMADALLDSELLQKKEVTEVKELKKQIEDTFEDIKKLMKKISKAIKKDQ